MTAERLGVAAVLTCICVAGLYTFAMPQVGADPTRSKPSALLTNVAIAAHMSPIGKQRDNSAKDASAPLSRSAQKLVEACRGPLARRGMSTGEGSKAVKVCTCVATNLEAKIGGSPDAMKLAGFYFDPLFEPDRKNLQVADRFVKRAKRYKRENRKVFKAVNSAVKSGCRVAHNLGIRLGYVSSVLIAPKRKRK